MKSPTWHPAPIMHARANLHTSHGNSKNTSGIILSASAGEMSPRETSCARSGLSFTLRSSVSFEQEIICCVQPQHRFVWGHWMHANNVPRTVLWQTEQQILGGCVPYFCTYEQQSERDHACQMHSEWLRYSNQLTIVARHA